jgi:hypothetical protein
MIISIGTDKNLIQHPHTGVAIRADLDGRYTAVFTVKIPQAVTFI